MKTSITKGNAREDKHKYWPDAVQIEKVYVQDNAKSLFDQLLLLINNHYAVIKDAILQELKSIPTSLVFQYEPNLFLNKNQNITMPSGSSAPGNFDVKGAKKFLGLDDK